MTGADLARMGAICARLPPDDAAWVANRLAPASYLRAARLDQRDGAVREALGRYSDWCQYRAAEALARELRNATACPHAIGERADLLRRIIQLSGDRPIGASQITNIMNGYRSGNL